MQVMREVRSELNTNPSDYADGRDTIISIVDAGEEICASLGTSTNPALTPDGSGTPVPNGTLEALQTSIPVSTPAVQGTPTPASTVGALQTLIAQFTPTATP